MTIPQDLRFPRGLRRCSRNYLTPVSSSRVPASISAAPRLDSMTLVDKTPPLTGPPTHDELKPFTRSPLILPKVLHTQPLGPILPLDGSIAAIHILGSVDRRQIRVVQHGLDD